MGQTLLTLASLVLLSLIAIQVGQMYTSSVESSVETQLTSDALNFARDLSDELHSFAFRYNELTNAYGNVNDVIKPDSRISFMSQVGFELFATVDLTSEFAVRHGQPGRMATIKVFEEKQPGEFRRIVEHEVTILNLNQNQN